MRAVILLNGEPHRGEISLEEDSYVLCCDGAYSWANGRVRIDENLGDFDSLSFLPTPAPRTAFPAEKNETDGELAVDRAFELGADSISFYGGGGGREDHFLGNLHLLYKAHLIGIPAILYTNGAAISLCGKGEHFFSCRKGQTVSLLPFGGDVHIMKMEGLKYAEKDLLLRYGSTRGVSNLTVSGEAFSFRMKRGYALVIMNEEEV